MSYKLPDYPFSNEEIREALEKLDQDPIMIEFCTKRKGTNLSSYRRGIAIFYLLTGYTPSDIISIHEKWIRDGGEHPIAQAMGDKDNPDGILLKYFIEIEEKWQIILDGKRESVTNDKIRELNEAGREYKVVWQGKSRKTCSNYHCGIRALVSSRFPLKQQHLPVQNLPAYTQVSRQTYILSLDDIRDLIAVASPYERWVILALFQTAMRPGDLLRLTYTKDIQEQEKLIEAGKIPPIITLKYRPQKTARMNTVGDRTTAFGYEAYEAWRRIKEIHKIKPGDPLFPGKARGAITQQWLTENFNRCARAIKLQERAGKNVVVRMYGLRGAGMSAWNRNVPDGLPNMGEAVSGHDMPGITENYNNPHVVREEYEKRKHFLNPSSATLEKQRSLEERIGQLEEEMERMKYTMENLMNIFSSLRLTGEEKKEKFMKEVQGE